MPVDRVGGVESVGPRTLPGTPGSIRTGTVFNPQPMNALVDAGALGRFLGETSGVPAPTQVEPRILPVLDIGPFIMGLPGAAGAPGVINEWSAAVESIVIANPAAGAQGLLTPPANEAYRVFAVHFRFVASAVAANRYLLVESRVTGSATEFNWRTLHNQAHTASQTADYSCQVGTGAIQSNLDRVFPMPYEAWVLPGHTLAIYAREIDAGDQLSRLRVLLQRFRV